MELTWLSLHVTLEWLLLLFLVCEVQGYSLHLESVYSDWFSHYFQVNARTVPQKSPTIASLNTLSNSLFTFVETFGVTQLIQWMNVRQLELQM